MKTIDSDQKEQIEAMVAEEGIAPAVLEKDIHVTDLLIALFRQPPPSGLQIAFGGGTALSKCFQLIQRMSEDVDLKFESLSSDSGLAPKAECRELTNFASKRAVELGFVIAGTKKYNSGRTQVFHLKYASQFPAVASLRPEIKLELFNSRILMPTFERDFRYMIDLEGTRGSANCLSPEQTLIEKAISLVRRYEQAGENKDSFDFRLLRHVYDVHAIWNSLDEPLHGELVRTIVDHDKATRKWTVTSNSFLETVKKIGNDTALPARYEQLVEDLMIGEIVKFDLAFETFSKIASEIGRFIDTLPERMLEIQYRLGLNKTQLADIFRVSRPTLYEWLEGGFPQPNNQARIESVEELLQALPAGTRLNARFVRNLKQDGKSLMELLGEEHFDETAIRSVIEQVVAANVAERATSLARESRLRKQGFEEVPSEQQETNLKTNVAKLDWPG